MSEGLEGINFEDRRKLLRLVVERITVEDNMVVIETIIPLTKICNRVHAVLSDSLYRIPPDSAAAESVSKDGSFLRQCLNCRKDQPVSYVVTSIT